MFSFETPFIPKTARVEAFLSYSTVPNNNNASFIMNPTSPTSNFTNLPGNRRSGTPVRHSRVVSDMRHRMLPTSFSPPNDMEDLNDDTAARKQQIAQQQQLQQAQQNKVQSNAKTAEITVAQDASSKNETSEQEGNFDGYFSKLSTSLISEEFCAKEGKTSILSNVLKPHGPAKGRMKSLEVCVFFRFGESKTESLKQLWMRLSENCVGIDVIKTALEEYKMQFKTMPPSDDVSAYVLRVSKYDGTPESSYPPLQKNTSIRDFKINLFSLMLDPNYVPKDDGRQGKSNTTSSSTAGGNSTGTANYNSNTANCRSRLEDIKLLIHIPMYTPNTSNTLFLNNNNNATNGRNHMSISVNNIRPRTLMVAPDILIKDLVTIIAERFDLSTVRFNLQTVSEQTGEKQEIPQHTYDKCVRTHLASHTLALHIISVNNNSTTQNSNITTAPISVSSQSLVNTNPLNPTGSLDEAPNLVVKVNYESDEEKERVPPLHSQVTAEAYQTWEVVKVNKYGKHQDRVLSIDHMRIYNDVPDKKYFSIKSMISSKKTKHPTRLIADVATVRCIEDKPKCFEIEFRVKDRPGTTETLFYEAKTADDAADIVSKIKYLIKNPYSDQKKASFIRK